MQDPSAGRSRRSEGFLQAHQGREGVWVAGLRRPGGVFGQFQYPTVPLHASDDDLQQGRVTGIFSWPLRVDSWPLQAIAGHDDVGGCDGRRFPCGLVPRPESFALFGGCRLGSRRGGRFRYGPPAAPPRLSTGTWHGAQVAPAWRVRRVLTGEGPGEVAGVRGPACGGCGHLDRLITWPDSR